MSLNPVHADPRVRSSLQQHGTPARRRSNSFASNHTLSGHFSVKKQMSRETSREFVGPMPIGEFFNNFLKIESMRRMPKVKANHFDTLPRASVGGGGILETDLYDPMIRLVEKARVMNNFTTVNTSLNPDPDSEKERSWKPDLSTYKKDDVPPFKEDEGTSPTDFSRIMLPWEFKSVDLFADPSPTATAEKRLEHNFLRGIEGGTINRGQVMAVLTELCKRQHRTHGFLLLICDPIFRILRVDRSGIIVTEAINFRDQSQTFAEFLYRFSEATDTQRGLDPTVRLATSEERSKSRHALTPWFPKDKNSWDVVTIEVHNKGSEVRRVVACGALTVPDSPTGRATRAYAVYDLEDDVVRFLKDTWRANVEGMEKESDILAYLNEKGVENVPTLTAGDDVPGEYQRTSTQDFLGKEWRAGKVAKLAPRAHHRILEDFVPYRVADFLTAQEMLEVVHHAFIAHRQAYEAGILHRDISDNNVMITKEGRGILTDWDLCIRVSPIEGGSERKPRQSYRTGTWFFMASQLLRNPHKLQDLQDDLESFFYLIFFLALTELPIKGLPEGPATIVDAVFGSCTWRESIEEWVGGDGKNSMITSSAHIGTSYDFPGNQPLTGWIMATLDALEEYYHWNHRKQKLEARLADNQQPTTSEAAQIPIRLRDHSFLDSEFQKALGGGVWTDNRLHKDEALARRCPEEPRFTRSSTKSSTSSLKRALPDDNERPHLPLKRSRTTLQRKHTPPQTPTRAAGNTHIHLLESPESPGPPSQLKRRSGRPRRVKKT